MKKLYKFHWDCYYGKITGLFVAEEQDIKDIIGTEINFGNVLGKYSDVYRDIQNMDFQEIDIDKETMDKLCISLRGNTI